MTADRSNPLDGSSTPDTLLNYVDGTERFSVIVQQADRTVAVLHVAAKLTYSPNYHS